MPSALLRNTAVSDAAMARAVVESAPLTITCYGSLEAAEPAWRQLEKSAILTPYQRYDWIAAFAAAQQADADFAVTVAYSGDRPVALLPLWVRSRRGLRIAEFIGTRNNNADWMIVDPDVSGQFGRPQLEALLAEVRSTAGADLFVARNQPAEWSGLANPLLAFPHQPAPDHLYVGPLGTDRLSANRMRNIMRGQRRLTETIGPVRLLHAATIEEIDAYHAAFLRQRGARFAEMGVDNIFAEDWFVRFFKSAARRSLGMQRPVLRLHALFAGDDILATAFGTYCGSHYSQYINSTASDGPAAKYSLIGILLYELVTQLQREGIKTLDMGLGDFAYKELWAEKLTVHDSVVALSGKGRMMAPPLLALRRLKRGIKQNPRLFGLAKQLRSLVHGRQAAGLGDPPDRDRDGK
jgi:CelD/BcsL family acetyltransferase involved in cellulose biosynthesis